LPRGHAALAFVNVVIRFTDRGRDSGYNTYRGWTQIEYQTKHYNIDQKDEETLDDQRRDGGTNFILRIKEQKTCLTFQEHDDDDDDVKEEISFTKVI